MIKKISYLWMIFFFFNTYSVDQTSATSKLRQLKTHCSFTKEQLEEAITVFKEKITKCPSNRKKEEFNWQNLIRSGI